LKSSTPRKDQDLQVVRQKVFEEAPNLPLEQEEDEWTAPLQKWAIDFVGPKNPLGKRTRARSIITATDYLTRWEEATTTKDCSATTVVQFIFDDIIT
jgi:hypothetical protein